MWKELGPKARESDTWEKAPSWCGMPLRVEEKGSRCEPQARGQLSWHHHVLAQKCKESKNFDIEPGLPGDSRDICFMGEDRTFYLQFVSLICNFIYLNK